MSPINPTEGFEQINREAREGFERICPRRPFVIPQEVNLTDIDRYLDTPPIVFKLSKSDNQTQWILNWWDGNKYEFPCMAQAARDYLPIPASEVDVERLFNVGRDVEDGYDAERCTTTQGNRSILGRLGNRTDICYKLLKLLDL